MNVHSENFKAWMIFATLTVLVILLILLIFYMALLWITQD
jgi:uncharacterized membrane protein YqiK